MQAELPKLSEIDRPLLSAYATRKKLDYFIIDIPKAARILEIGSGGSVVKQYLQENGWSNYVGLDVVPPADIVGDIKQWRDIGLEEESFDVIIAFEVLEHVDCIKECHDLCKPGGMMLATSPVPSRDWACRVLELIGLSQKRTSPHDNLLWFKKVPHFTLVDYKTVGFLSQWARFRKP